MGLEGEGEGEEIRLRNTMVFFKLHFSVGFC